MENYINQFEENLKQFKNFLSSTYHYRQEFKTDNFRFIVLKGFHRFLLNKKLQLNVKEFQESLKSISSNTIKTFQQIKKENHYPNNDDLDGVILGLLRIQEVYDISAEKIANGIINGTDFKTRLDGSDCLEIAIKLSIQNFSYYAIQWYKMTLRRFNEGAWKSIIPKRDKTIIIDLLTQSQYKEDSLNSLKDAIEILSNVLKDNDNNSYELYFAEKLKIVTERYLALESGAQKETSMVPPLGSLNRNNLTLLNILKQGCRNELKKPFKEERELFCKYETNNHPFLLIAPIKIEILNLSPYLVIFHEIIYDSEIEILETLSSDKLSRSKVWNAEVGKAESSAHRTSKIVWLYNETHPLMHILNQRVMDMTGLTMETTEEFQLMNYGIGGHYDLHADYLTRPGVSKDNEQYSYFEWGDRIGTVLFYLSDIFYGGGTVWPYINVSATPRKGTAAFWYNLKNDGQPDFKTIHAACPVLVGSKWVMNKWIREGGQIFRRPCHSLPA